MNLALQALAQFIGQLFEPSDADNLAIGGLNQLVGISEQYCSVLKL
jgi:hypothetical protein